MVLPPTSINLLAARGEIQLKHPSETSSRKQVWTSIPFLTIVLFDIAATSHLPIFSKDTLCNTG